MLIALLAGAQQGNLHEYAFALTGELAACKKYAAECETLQRDFAMRSQERERLAQKEIARLKAELLRLQSQKKALLESKNKLDAECHALEDGLQLLRQPLSAAEQRLEEQKKYLPETLRETLLPPLQGDDIAARLNRYLETIASIKDFSRNLHKPFPMKMQGADGEMREYQVMMLGLSLALACSEASGNAGIGIRQGENWQWNWNKTWHAPISKAMGICSGTRAPELIPLPLQSIINEGSRQ